MKNKNYHTVGTIPKYNRKIVEKADSVTLTHQYIPDHFGMVQALQENVPGLSKSSHLSEMIRYDDG